MTPECHFEVLCSVPKCKKTTMCLTEKTCVSDKLFPDMTHNAVGLSLMQMKQYTLNKMSLNRNTY